MNFLHKTFHVGIRQLILGCQVSSGGYKITMRMLVGKALLKLYFHDNVGTSNSILKVYSLSLFRSNPNKTSHSTAIS